MSPFEPFTLTGRFVELAPLRLDHLEPLVAAATEDRSSYALTGVPSDAPSMARYVETALALRDRGQAVPFATFDLARGRFVGSTRFGNLERWSWPYQRPAHLPTDLDAAEIGWTWLAASAQRTALNTEAKLLMLTHAFEHWRLYRVAIRTDARNARSRSAIERLGAKFEGILRHHMPAYDGGLRDTATYSVVADDWPAVKAGLERKLAKALGPGGAEPA
jgi:RimJ/RimL family protein N-acetyltransferase